MGETLAALRRLQEVEIELAVLRRDREAGLRRVEIRQKLIKKLDDQIEAQRRSLRERQVYMDSMSLDIAVREESINKHRQALNKAKTNKEYATILAALNTEKADNLKIETSALEAMKEVDVLKAEADRLAAERVKFAADLAKAEGELQGADDHTEPQRKQLESRRREIARTIPAETIELFTRAAHRHDGEAMAAVTKVRPKHPDYTCGGCNMKVTIEVVSALSSRRDIRVCESCGRVLYIEDSAAKSAR
ncbi:MAG: C4-type zinc ribbon domain-containing protein [Planctomycetota bacterium]